jgi:hypothetical protein
MSYVYKRCAETEIAFERLIECLENNPSLLVSNELSEQSDKLANRNKELESDLRVVQAELDKHRVEEAAKSPLSKKRKTEPKEGGETLPVLSLKSIDTASVAKSIQTILLTNRITVRLFAREVISSYDSEVSTMLNNPTPWTTCTCNRKRVWAKLFEWSQSSEAIRLLAAKAASKPRRRKLEDLQHLPEVPANLQLDTDQLAKRVNQILRAESIAIGLIAQKMLAVDANILKRLLKNPIAWSHCSEFRKRVYLKVNEWSQSIEEIRRAKELCEGRNFSNFQSLPELPAHSVLDTAEVAGKVRRILAAENILHEAFAKHVLSINVVSLGNLLRNPTVWTECADYRKKLYFRMHEWSQSSKDIRSLKVLVESERTELERLQLAIFKSLPDVPARLELNTAEVVSTLDQVLQSACLTRRDFGRKVLAMSTTEIYRLMNHPISWSKCTLLRKKQYLKMHLWSQSIGEIQSLKSSIQA